MSAGAFAQAPEDDEIRYYILDQVVYDDNLFRLPAGLATQFIGAGARRNDDINQAGLGIDGQGDLSRQSFVLNALLEDNRYLHNTFLNNISGNGRGEWDWQIGNDVSGQLGAQYNRTLADFANTQIYGKDIVNVLSYFGSGRFRIWPRWAVIAGARHSATTQSASALQFQNNDLDTGNFGLEYSTPPDDTGDESAPSDVNTIGLDYRYSRAHYAHPAELDGSLFLTNFYEAVSSVRLTYLPTAKLVLQGDAGYLHRNYADAAIGDFSGPIWHASLKWELSDRTQVLASGWRELKAYVEAESNYFVGKGFSIAPTWAPTERTSLAIREYWENQQFTGSSPLLIQAPRHDIVQDASAILTYTPRRALQITASFRFEHRASNQFVLAYNDNLAGLGIKLTW